MRFTRLTAAVLAAAGLLALSPAGAFARVHAGVRGTHANGCRVRLAVSPHIVTSGESALLTGDYICSGAAVAGQTATFYEHVAGAGSFNPIGTATTGATGEFTGTASAVVADSDFYAVVNSARSATRTVKVAPQVTVIPPAPEGTAFFTGFAHRVAFTGSVSPEDRGAEVVLERENGTVSEEWGMIQRHVFVQPDGTFSLVHRFSVPGDANLRIVVRPHGRFDVRGVSDAMSYSVTQTQNPNLTLEPSPRPVTFGQSLTLSGTTKAGAGAKVVVTGRVFGGVTTVVGEPTAGAGGAWTLTIPAVQSTRYHAISGKYHSAQVFVGVKWGLVVNPIASSVASGTEAAFTGTASPGTRTGHVVYLERHNATGSAWHVVNIGFTAAGGTFSIPWFFVGSGKESFRIKIPGDPINVAAASAPLETEVTPPAVATPTPVLQPTLPH
jgi:hypothetical protein